LTGAELPDVCTEGISYSLCCRVKLNKNIANFWAVATKKRNKLRRGEQKEGGGGVGIIA
jgi:hypothetical protein